MKAQLLITLTDDDQVHVAAPVQAPYLCFRLLAAAMNAVCDGAEAAAAASAPRITLADGPLPVLGGPRP